MNIETKVANRARSIFTALGTIVNDFYLEAGIYFIGGFNALLVAWGLFSEMMATRQPLAYAIAISAIAFITTEGLTVLLVGAAAKTNSPLLWFFSVVFAGFFTFAHYQTNVGNGNISQYISLAIPFFAVVGYMARTMKNNAEGVEVANEKKQLDAIAKQDQLDADRRQRQVEAIEKQRKLDVIARQKEAEELAHEREIDRLKLANAQELKLAKINKNKAANGEVRPLFAANADPLDRARTAKKGRIAERQNEVAGLRTAGKKTSEIAKILNCSADTVRRDIKQLNGKMEVIG